jgi:undecaprenol kinase/diacylglycerol kinase (ATP)
MNPIEEKKVWREEKVSKKFLNAWSGLCVFAKTTKHLFYLHLPIYMVGTIMGFCFHISSFEWCALVLAMGLLLLSEIFNTALEIDIDLTSPEYHPYARDTKDVAALAVAVSGIIGLIVALIIFLPKILALI